MDRWKKSCSLLCAIAFVFACSGLTSAQREGVQSFGKAAAGYSKMPGQAPLDAEKLQQIVAALQGAAHQLQGVIDAVNTVAQVVSTFTQIIKLAAGRRPEEKSE